MESKRVLEIFQEITRIPRESGHEGPMGEYLLAFASRLSLEARQDKAGNVVIVKPSSEGRENVPTLVLQAHQDMVCEKTPESTHDFLHDPIPYVIEDGWMIAKETTLGADDGIGVAACLALLESNEPMGRLECLFTISEETSMDGAEALEKGFFSGKTLINLDSEDEGQFFIGCAGGMDTVATFKYMTEPLQRGSKILKISVSGGLGGHSGDEINKERANAVQQLVRFLYTELQYDWQLLSIDGGGRPNAIARDAEAIIAVPEDEADDMIGDVEAFQKILSNEFRLGDPGITISCAGAQCSLEPVGEEYTVRIISALYACPHGVAAMSHDIPAWWRPRPTWRPSTWKKARPSRSSPASAVRSIPPSMPLRRGLRPRSFSAAPMSHMAPAIRDGNPISILLFSVPAWRLTRSSSVPIRKSRPFTPASNVDSSLRSSPAST